MKKRTISFSPPDMGELEEQQVIDTLRSGWITTGPKTKKLERKLAGFLGISNGVVNGQKVTSPNLVCLGSATASEELILRILGVGPGDEVIVPAYTYTSTAAAAIHTGAKVVFIDCQSNSLEMNYEQMADAINEHTKAIVPVDLGGVPCDYDRIFEIVEDKRDLYEPMKSDESADDLTKLGSRIQHKLDRIAVVADGAHALGAHRYVKRYSCDISGQAVRTNRMVGAISDFTSFSFHAVKNFTTAEGGAACWNLPFSVSKNEDKDKDSDVSDEEIYHWFQLLSLHGQSKDALAKAQVGAWEYDIVAPLYKCNMTDIMAGIGLAQLKRYPGLLNRRREIVKRYDEICDQLDVDHIHHYTNEYTSSGHLYITWINGCDDSRRREIITRMAEQGVATNVHYKPLPMMTGYKRMGADIQDYPNAYKLYSNEITLPLHTKLSDEDVDYVTSVFSDAVRMVRGY